MKVILFIIEVAKKYPGQFLLTLVMLLVLNFIDMGTVLTIAPLIDLMLNSDLNGASSLTRHLLDLLRRLNLPATIYGVMLLILAFEILKAITTILVYSSVLRTKYALVRDVICNTYETFFNAGWNFFVSNSQGVMGNTFIKETNKIGDSFGYLGMMFVKTFQIIFYFILAFIVSWKISLIIMLLGFLIAAPFSFLGRLTYKLGKINLETANRIYEIVQENLAAAKIIIGYGEQGKGNHSLKSAVDKHVSATLRSQVINKSIGPIFHPLAMGLLFFSFFISRTIITIPFAELSVVLYSFYSSLPLLSQVITSKNDLLNFFPAYEQVNSLRFMAEKALQPSGDIIFKRLESEIIFSKVSFSYPERELVVRDLDIVIPKGDMVALVGRSGAGKTTAIDLLMRLYEPDSGAIWVDGVNLKDLDVLSWRHKIGYVPQDTILFNISIRENLKWAKEEASEEEILRACGIANVNDFLAELPKGLDTIIGDRGVRLSGGQRQRLSLARAVLRRPELLILDEATSSLDSHSEKLIQEAIENIAHETTLVVVAHRLSTIVNADNIYVIEDGQVIEEGSYAKLCAQRGKYYELAKIQGMA